jgi:DNA-damage-inducible protein J
MAQTSINIRTDEKLKKQFDTICSELGLNLSTAVNIFMRTVVRQKRIPFPLAIDNERRFKALGELSKEEFDLMMQKSFADVEAGRVRHIKDVFDDFERKYEI